MQHVTSALWHMPSEFALSRGHVKAAPSHGAKKLVADSASKSCGRRGLMHTPSPLLVPPPSEQLPIDQRSSEQPERTASSALQEHVIGTEKPSLLGGREVSSLVYLLWFFFL